MNNKLDQGDIGFTKEKFNLKGNAEQIYNSCLVDFTKIIEKLLKNELKFITKRILLKNFKRIKNNAIVIKKKSIKKYL